MKRVLPGEIGGKAAAPRSKSMMQRAVAAAALAAGKSVILGPAYCDDALAAIACAKKLGARVRMERRRLIVNGRGKPAESRVPGAFGSNDASGIVLDCGESGLCMRMFAPIAALFGRRFVLTGTGSLLPRPMGMVEAPLRALGASCSTNGGKPPIAVQGPLSGGETEVDGASSSQFLTGLLMALPLCPNDSALHVRNLKSKPYVRMTLSLLREFGISVRHSAGLDRLEIPGRQSYRACRYSVEGDWSGASFLLVAGAVAGRVEVDGLDACSPQADRAVLEALRKAGARVRVANGRVEVSGGNLCGFEFDASDCPDLFPPLAALACSCSGESRIVGAMRLRGKESDRGEALAAELGKMGARVRLEEDSMVIRGGRLRGGKVDSHNDHRIAMACAVAALRSEKGAAITNAECVSKSYPGFFRDLESLRVR